MVPDIITALCFFKENGISEVVLNSLFILKNKNTFYLGHWCSGKIHALLSIQIYFFIT